MIIISFSLRRRRSKPSVYYTKGLDECVGRLQRRLYFIANALKIWRFVSHVEISTWCSRQFFRSETILYIRRNFSAITFFAILALLFQCSER